VIVSEKLSRQSGFDRADALVAANKVVSCILGAMQLRALELHGLFGPHLMSACGEAGRKVIWDGSHRRHPRGLINGIAARTRTSFHFVPSWIEFRLCSFAPRCTRHRAMRLTPSPHLVSELRTGFHSQASAPLVRRTFLFRVLDFDTHLKTMAKHLLRSRS